MEGTNWYFVVLKGYKCTPFYDRLVTQTLNAGKTMNPKNVNPTHGLYEYATGEITPLDVLFKPGQGKWERVYARALASMLEITGDEKTTVIAYLIKKKDYENRVIATMRNISEKTEVSLKTVNRTMQILQKNNYIHKVQNGVWRFSPHVMRTGVEGLGAAVVEMYDKGK